MRFTDRRIELALLDELGQGGRNGRLQRGVIAQLQIVDNELRIDQPAPRQLYIKRPLG